MYACLHLHQDQPVKEGKERRLDVVEKGKKEGQEGGSVAVVLA